MGTMIERLQAELEAATAELKEHMGSWAYAFAMGAGNHGGQNHPVHVATRERTARLQARCHDLRAQLAEHRL
jgi:hypothetical protein